MMMNGETISVSEYLDRLNSTLKASRAKIIGEVTNVQEYPGRSYLYFSLKDGVDGSTMKCFMWKRDFVLSGLQLRDGLEVIVNAYPNIYKPNGGLTMQVETVELVGEGALQLAYLALRKKLEDEGLFLESSKREIPEFPQRIGVITSKSGAVINDFLSNIGKFGFEILFVDSRVEGQDAVKDLLASVKKLKNEDLDVLVIMRGGGSLESFLAFNNEALIRAVADFPAPVLTGIGHDKDVPLLSLVSDRNVSTPTAVANLLNSTWSEALAEVRFAEEKIFSTFHSFLQDAVFVLENSESLIQRGFAELISIFKTAEETLLRAVDNIGNAIRNMDNSINLFAKEIERGFSLGLSEVKEGIRQAEKAIELSNPERQLSHGYSIVRNKGKILRSVKDAAKDDNLDIYVKDGIIKTKAI